MANLIAKLRKILGSGLVPSAYYLVMRLIWWVLFKVRKNDETAPKVTVVIPVYNVEQYLADCLRSVRSQGYSNFEIIAVNDGATDRSAEILQQFASTLSLIHI